MSNLSAMHQSSAGSLRKLLLATTSVVALSLASVMSSQAADVAPASASAPFAGTTVSVYGGYLFNDSKDAFGGTDAGSKLGNLAALKPGHDGGDFGLSVGHAIDPMWDWKFAVQGDEFGAASTYDGTNFARSDFDFEFADAELGHTTMFADGDALRLFAGARFLHADSDIDYGTSSNDYHSDGHFWAFGPRAGLEGSMPLWASPFSLRGSVAGSVLFADGHQDFVYDAGGPGSSQFGLDQPIWNAAISASVAYNFNPNAMIEVGYQAEEFWNLAPSVFNASINGDLTPGQADVLSHGPFLKFTAKLP